MTVAVDCDAGNLRSVETALHQLGATSVTVDDRLAAMGLLFPEARR